MFISTDGILVNQHGELLVIYRSDTKTWAVPGGQIDPGETAVEATVREFEEETGFKVLPVRLVAVHYVPFPKQPFVVFMFRCLMRGGEPKTSLESPDVGYVKTNPLKVRMLGFHRKRTEPALTHRGKAILGTYELNVVEKIAHKVLHLVVYNLVDVIAFFTGRPPYFPPKPWKITVNVLIQNGDGAVLWQQDQHNGLWTLPGGVCSDTEAPWDAAVRHMREAARMQVVVDELVGVYTLSEDEMVMVFSAETTSYPPTSYTWCQPGSEQPNTRPSHIARVTDALDPYRELTVFKKKEIRD